MEIRKYSVNIDDMYDILRDIEKEIKLKYRSVKEITSLTNRLWELDIRASKCTDSTPSGVSLTTIVNKNKILTKIENLGDIKKMIFDSIITDIENAAEIFDKIPRTAELIIRGFRGLLYSLSIRPITYSNKTKRALTNRNLLKFEECLENSETYSSYDYTKSIIIAAGGEEKLMSNEYDNEAEALKVIFNNILSKPYTTYSNLVLKGKGEKNAILFRNKVMSLKINLTKDAVFKMKIKENKNYYDPVASNFGFSVIFHRYSAEEYNNLDGWTKLVYCMYPEDARAMTYELEKLYLAES